MVALRPGAASDLPALVAIYNHYVEKTSITFDVEPFSVETRRPWFEQFGGAAATHLIVAEHAGETDRLCPPHALPRQARVRSLVETSIYLAPPWTRRGLGQRLYAALFAALAGEDVHRAYAGVTLPNAPSIALHGEGRLHARRA